MPNKSINNYFILNTNKIVFLTKTSNESVHGKGTMQMAQAPNTRSSSEGLFCIDKYTI